MNAITPFVLIAAACAVPLTAQAGTPSYSERVCRKALLASAWSVRGVFSLSVREAAAAGDRSRSAMDKAIASVRCGSGLNYSEYVLMHGVSIHVHFLVLAAVQKAPVSPLRAQLRAAMDKPLELWPSEHRKMWSSARWKEWVGAIKVYREALAQDKYTGRAREAYQRRLARKKGVPVFRGFGIWKGWKADRRPLGEASDESHE